MFFSAKAEQEKIENDLETKVLFELQEDIVDSFINTPKIANKENFMAELKKLVK